MRELALMVLLATATAASTTVESQTPQSAALTIDPAWKLPEVIAFIGVKKGNKVADIVAGRLTGSLAKAVGPTGIVYAVETAEVVKVHPEIMGKADVLAAGFKFDAKSSILANKSDDHTKSVFDPAVRGHADQFLYRFKKPKMKVASRGSLQRSPHAHVKYPPLE